MKRVILVVAAVAMIVLVSCKKDRTCRCQIDYNNNGISYSGSADTLFLNVTESDAEAKCSGLDVSVTSGNNSITSVCNLK